MYRYIVISDLINYGFYKWQYDYKKLDKITIRYLFSNKNVCIYKLLLGEYGAFVFRMFSVGGWVCGSQFESPLLNAAL